MYVCVYVCVCVSGRKINIISQSNNEINFRSNDLKF